MRSTHFLLHPVLLLGALVLLGLAEHPGLSVAQLDALVLALAAGAGRPLRSCACGPASGVAACQRRAGRPHCSHMVQGQLQAAACIMLRPLDADVSSVKPEPAGSPIWSKLT